MFLEYQQDQIPVHKKLMGKGEKEKISTYPALLLLLTNFLSYLI
jgi:hypothetical protein